MIEDILVREYRLQVLQAIVLLGLLHLLLALAFRYPLRIRAEETYLISFKIEVEYLVPLRIGQQICFMLGNSPLHGGGLGIVLEGRYCLLVLGCQVLVAQAGDLAAFDELDFALFADEVAPLA